MIIIIPDASIFIALEQASLLNNVFNCGAAIAVPDLIYSQDLEVDNGRYLRSLGMSILSLTPDEVARAQELKSKQRSLSLSECFALVCSLRPNHCILAINKPLKKEATLRGSMILSLPSLLEQMEKHNVPKHSLASEVECLLSSRYRMTISRDEVEEIRKRWQ